MPSDYHLDAKTYPIKKLLQDLQSRNLIPSRQPLRAGLEESFRILEDLGLKNLNDLLGVLKNKQKVKDLSAATGISEEYLVLLRREVNSYFPNPVSLAKFSGFPDQDLDRLREIGITNSRHLYERIGSAAEINTLSMDSGISRADLTHLWALSDLVRAYGVGPAFAAILYDIGIDSIVKLKSFTPQQVVDLYEKQTGKKADFSLSDIKFSLDLIAALETGEDHAPR